LLSPVALVQQATYVIDQIQKEKEKVLCVAFLLFACLIPGISSLMSQYKVQKRKLLLLPGIAFGTILLLSAFCQI
jgi:hypothetical protein